MGLVSQHPHIVTVFNAAFTSTKQPCIVMELYSGGTLGERQKREGQLPVAVVLDVGVKIAGALQTAHDRGLLHRDIKPQNLFISEFGEPALGDFGISTLDDERSISGGGGLTVHYAPPEVLEGAPATAISDVYSFAATLYTLLEGARPFAGPRRRTAVGRRARPADHARGTPPARRPDDVPRSLADLLARTMSKRPERPPAVGGRVRPGAAARPGRARSGRHAAAAGHPARRRGPAAARRRARRRRAPSRRPSGDPRRRPRPCRRRPTVGSLRTSSCAPSTTATPATTTITATPSRSAAAPCPSPTSTTSAARRTRRRAGSCSARWPASCACSPWPPSLLLFGRGGDDDDDPTTLGRAATTQLLQFRPPAPQGVTVAAGAEPGTGRRVLAGGRRAGRRIHYQVRPQTDGVSAAEHRPAGDHVRGHPRRRAALLHRRRHHPRRPPPPTRAPRLPLTSRCPVLTRSQGQI